jgi:hypothetical protein
MKKTLPADQLTLSNVMSELLQSAYSTATHPALKALLPKPEEITPKAAKVADQAVILHQSGEDSPEPNQLWRARQYLALMSKNSHLSQSDDGDRRTACYEKFKSVQVRNRITTRRLNYYLRHPSRMSPTVAVVLGHAALDVQKLLGAQLSTDDWRTFNVAKVFSNGTSQGLRPVGIGPRRVRALKDTTAYGKLAPGNTITTTVDCLVTFGGPLMKGASANYLSKRNASLVNGARGTSVPKDAEVDRFIAVEPALNGMAQQGLRAVLEKRLRNWGVTLDKQSRNQDLARIASEKGFSPQGYSTIDLSSASDTITAPLVEYLLPKGWYRLIDAARSPEVEIEGETVTGYSSFMTMGNATTFPLQCLLFAAITRACIRMCSCDEREYRVYGDDIIIPSSASALLIEVLRFVGFRTNVQKSFVIGFFRESCGGDYLCGVDVTPIKLTEDITLASTRHVLFNLIQRRAPSHPVLFSLYRTFRKPLIGPAVAKDGVADSHLECPHHKLLGRGRSWYAHREQTIFCRVPILVSESFQVERPDSERSYLAALSGQGMTGNNDAVRRHGLRDSAMLHVRGTVFNLGTCLRLERYSLVWTL